MIKGFFSVPVAVNEPVLNYSPGSKEKSLLQTALNDALSKQAEIGMYIGNQDIFTSDKIAIRPPHDHARVLGHYSQGTKEHALKAIDAALDARAGWEKTPWEHRAAIFLKAADLLAGPYRYKINAASMLAQSKNAYQAEIDAACEFIDFLRFNVQFMTEIYSQQPLSGSGTWNRLEYRGLEGFVYAITPFNFTSIAGNLPASAALMGNVVIWKPSDKQIYSAAVLMEVFKEAGLPAGVMNMIFCDPIEASAAIFAHPEFAGIHFTGSTTVFKNIWKTIAENLDNYRNFPRIVGETGGKDFMLIHASAEAKTAATALIRGAFEYQGQKCSAASRAYISASVWTRMQEFLLSEMKTIKMGPVEDFGNFINAVIDEKSFDKLASYIDRAKSHDNATIIAGGGYDKSVGYFIEPTLILTTDPQYETMQDELFGPVLSIYIFEDTKFEETLDLIDRTSSYALTGGIMSQDRKAIMLAEEKLKNAAGNFYINDKCTGAVVGQQPFGGGRSSGTNDKAGSPMNLLRWVSVRAIKENFNPPASYRYAFLDHDQNQ